jgi:hypothetical protein
MRSSGYRDCADFLGAIDGLDRLATVIGVTYRLGKSFPKLVIGLG